MAAVLTGMFEAGCSVFGIRTAPEPRYTVERTIDPGQTSVQVRDYGPLVAAETVVPGERKQALNTGFTRLAGYIFGANGSKTSLAMTVPVVQAPGQVIASAAPAPQAEAAPGGWRIRFIMPPGQTLQSLPTPNDPAVTLLAIPAERVAVLRYSGIASDRAVADAQSRLLQTVAGANLATDGVPFSWFYDPPWTIPPLRRNEAVVRLRG